MLPYHRVLDEQREFRKGTRENRHDQARHRPGLRRQGRANRPAHVRSDAAGLVLEETAARRFKENNSILTAFGAKPLNFDEVNRGIPRGRAKSCARSSPTRSSICIGHCSTDKEILFEGAQGTFLDIDHGTYPYVTSSNTTAGGACTGSGVPPHRMDRGPGVMKAYTTRVGEGPFPTEDAAIADMLHGMGREFGATTGRARRCGWFDAVATRYATMINGIDELAITNLDGLDTVDPIHVCVGYRLNGKRLDVPPCDAAQLAELRADLRVGSGWKTSTHTAKKFSDLPSESTGVTSAHCGANRREIEDGERRADARADDHSLAR